MEQISLHLRRVLKREVSSVTPVGGGSISTTVKATLDNGDSVFAKVSPQQKDMFLKEANGLRELTKSEAIRIPKVLFADEEILVLEYLPSVTPSSRKKFFEEFGRQFARLHRSSSASFGFTEDNYIGSTPQQNTPCTSSWKDFYLTHRLQYQFRLAEKNGYADARLRGLYGLLERRIDDLLPGDGELPALLHGDLWGGNYLCLEGDVPVIIDPAVYYGHREADIAMTMLFGGFDDSFYRAYNNAYPLHPGWQRRMELYKLYHLFNHMNLFGEGYYGQVTRTMAELTKGKI